MWALSEPVLPGDFLLLDEAQDTNPVLEQIVLAHKERTQIVMVGDSAQAIYGWRGARDVMARFAGHHLTLARSFRFGPALAISDLQPFANLIDEHGKAARSTPIVALAGQRDSGRQFGRVQVPEQVVKVDPRTAGVEGRCAGTRRCRWDGPADGQSVGSLQVQGGSSRRAPCRRDGVPAERGPSRQLVSTGALLLVESAISQANATHSPHWCRRW